MPLNTNPPLNLEELLQGLPSREISPPTAAAPALGPLPESATPPPPPPAYRVLTLEELAALPPPTWLVDDMIPAGGLACLYGPSGGGKTFFALDWGLCVASGRPWMEHVVQAGPVIYITGEGVGGLNKRVQAWRQAHGLHAPIPFYVVPVGVNLMDLAAAEALLASLPTSQPACIIIDTLARSMVGGDENTAHDMGLFIAGIDLLRARTPATVLVVHHTGKQGLEERGSSALRGASDTMISLVEDDDLHVLECTKQKDAIAFPRSLWQLNLIAEADSLVVAPASGAALTGTRGTLSAKQLQVLEVIGSPSLVGGARYSEAREASSYSSSTFKRSLDAVNNRGLVRVEGPPHSKERRYHLTPEGATLLAAGRVPPSAATVPPTSTTVSGQDGTLTDPEFHSSTVPPPYQGGTDGTVNGGGTVAVALDALPAGQVIDPAQQKEQEADPLPAPALEPPDVWQATGPRGQAPPAGICAQPDHQVQWYRRTVWRCRTCAEAPARNGHLAAAGQGVAQ